MPVKDENDFIGLDCRLNEDENRHHQHDTD
jgi:hypothetical protein